MVREVSDGVTLEVERSIVKTMAFTGPEIRRRVITNRVTARLIMLFLLII